MALSLTFHGVNKYQKPVIEEEDGSLSTNGLSNNSASAITHSPPLCGNGNEYVHKNTHHQLEEAESLINLKANEFSNLMQGSESFLSFQQSCMFSKESNLHEGYNEWNHVSPRSTTDMRLVQNLSCFEIATANGESSFGWLYSEPKVSSDTLHDSAAEELVLRKRSSMVFYILLPQFYFILKRNHRELYEIN